jgi:hypothetical protein
MAALPFRCVVKRPKPRSLRLMLQAMSTQFWLRSVCRPMPDAQTEQYAPIPLQSSLHHWTRAQSRAAHLHQTL